MIVDHPYIMAVLHVMGFCSTFIILPGFQIFFILYVKTGTEVLGRMTAKSIVVCRVLPQGFLSQVRQACSNVDS
jgi:hypothetical protein